MIKRLLAGLAFFTASANAALATGDIQCRSADGRVNISLLVSHADTLTVLRTAISIGEEIWSSDQTIQAGAPILAGQAFDNDGVLLVDFISEPAGAIVARLKAFSLEDGNDFVSGGVFSFTGKGSFVVDCSERG